MKRPILNSAEASAEPAAATRPPAGLPRYVGEAQPTTRARPQSPTPASPPVPAQPVRRADYFRGHATSAPVLIRRPIRGCVESDCGDGNPRCRCCSLRGFWHVFK
jgi:hypothetical protein